MTRIITNIKEFDARMVKRIRALKKNPVKAAHEIGRFIKIHAKNNAPKKSGQLASGVISRNLKRGATVFAFDPRKRVYGTNALALWADRRIPFQFVRPHQPYFQPKQTVWYGRRARTISGRSVRWTGRAFGDAGYFTLAVRKGRRLFGKKMNRAVKTALNGVEI